MYLVQHCTNENVLRLNTHSFISSGNYQKNILCVCFFTMFGKFANYHYSVCELKIGKVNRPLQSEAVIARAVSKHQISIFSEFGNS